MVKIIILAVFSFIMTIGFNASAYGQIDENGIADGTPVKLNYGNLTITPPAGYKFLSDMSAFVNPDKETSISILKNDSISYYLLVAVMLKEDFSLQSAKLVSHEEIPGKKGMIFTFRFVVQNTDIERMVYVTGNETFSVTVNANYKLADKPAVIDELKNSILSIQF